jgi:hypothetical protein
MKTRYSQHYKDYPEGHIFLEKAGPCIITLQGAASMSQKELNSYGKICAQALARAGVAEDMLEALKALREWEGIMGGFEAPCWKQLHDAIAKAEK